MADKELFGISEQLGHEKDHVVDSTKMVEDLISRQAAIDALVGVTMFKTKHEIMQRVNASVQDEQGWLGAVAECLDEIEDLPSAQQEIVACGDCKHWVCHDRRCGYWNHGVKPLDWCCHAERRSDG